MPPKKSQIAQGLEVLLNDSRTNPFSVEGAKGFKAVMEASNLPLSETLKYLGKKKKAPKQSDSDRSKERIEKLETETTEK